MSTPGTTVSMDEYHAAIDRREKRIADLNTTIKALETDLADTRTKLVHMSMRLARIEVEAVAIAGAVGERGLLDLADDVRLLGRLAERGS